MRAFILLIAFLTSMSGASADVEMRELLSPPFHFALEDSRPFDVVVSCPWGNTPAIKSQDSNGMKLSCDRGSPWILVKTKQN